MRIYISGPMTGVPNHNFDAFWNAANRLRVAGHFVINPTELSAPFGTEDEIASSFQEYYLEEPIISPKSLAPNILAADLAAVRSCDAIYLLRGWESSRGAKRELAEAIAHNLQIIQEGNE